MLYINKLDFIERESRFNLGEEFSFEFGRGQGTLHTLCTVTEINVLRCTSEERTKSWHFDSEMRFSEAGMVNERYFINKGIKTKKYFQRISETKDSGVQSEGNEESILDSVEGREK